MTSPALMKREVKDSVGEQATLRANETVSASGDIYLKIEEINPPGGICVQPSGTYERREWN